MAKKPKTPFTFRLADEHAMVLAKYQLDHKLKNMTEALEQILTNCSFLSPISSSGASDLLPCKQRLGVEPKMACLNPPTLYRKVKITEINPEICRACQVLSLNLADSTRLTQTQSETADSGIQATAPAESFERSRDPSNSTRKNTGQVWCPDGGFWKYLVMCDKCREQTYPQWYNCHTEKLRQKGEEQRASTVNPPS